jgi:hypothetical protein
MMTNKEISHWELFVSDTCPNCPKVKTFAKNSLINGDVYNVSSGGLEQARKRAVLKVPTFTLISKNNTVLATADAIESIKNLLKKHTNY